MDNLQEEPILTYSYCLKYVEYSKLVFYLLSEFLEKETPGQVQVPQEVISKVSTRVY